MPSVVRDSAYYGNSDFGNFQALLDFRDDSGDQILQKHFETAPRNASYRSKTIQNELISCVGEIITDEVIVNQAFNVLCRNGR